MIKSAQSYCIVNGTELLRSIITDFIVSLNLKDNIYLGGSIFGKCIKISLTEKPTDDKFIISYDPTNLYKLETIDIDYQLVKIVAQMFHKLDNNYSTILKYLDGKVKRLNKDLDLIYYFLCRVFSYSEITIDLIDKLIDDTFKGIYTTSQKYEATIQFVNNPNEGSLGQLLKIVNDYNDIINVVANLVFDTPQWILDKFPETQSKKFIMTLLKLSLTIQVSDSKERFILEVLSKIIYGDK